jgi:NADH-quinone oxidoreductase subunit C
MEEAQLLEAVTALQPGVQALEAASDCPAVAVGAESLLPLMRALRDTPALAFNQLVDHTSVDWLKEDRFELIYHLYSLEFGHTLRVSCSVPRAAAVVPSVASVWPIAEWQEREVYDLMGILYADHPDLRRLFLDDDWQGFPLRKDYEDDYILKPTS